MLDIKFIRENAEAVRKMLDDRKVEADLDGFLQADNRFRQVVDEVNSLKHEKNVVSKEISKEKDPEVDTAALIEAYEPCLDAPVHCCWPC